MKFLLSKLTIFFILSAFSLFSQNNIPSDVFAALSQSKNKDALQAVINHYQKTEDSLKLKSAYFLIENMPIHQTYTYFWADSLNQKVEFDELSYPSFSTSIQGFESLKAQKGNLHPVPEIKKDLDVISTDFLIENIENAFKVWDKSKYDFNTFCEYLLPYRINGEPLYSWRNTYQKKYSQVLDSLQNDIFPKKIKSVIDDINRWFLCTYNIEKRNEPLPFLGSLQLLQRKKGACEDVAATAVFALRSVGIPATTDVVPYWATSTGGHTLNCAFDTQNKPIPFDVLLKSDNLNEFIREPAKVFRTTFSKQENTLAAQVSYDQIPHSGMLQSQNYIDVTNEYWATSDVTCKLKSQREQNKIVYASVFNGGKWKPVWWGNQKKDSVTFTKMCKGAVYLPQYFENGKLITAGYPTILGNNKIVVLKPDSLTHTVTISEMPKYLKFRPGKSYRLVYYDYGWKEIATKIADETTKELIFERVPKNALLLLMPNYGEKKERPFVITDERERLWW